MSFNPLIWKGFDISDKPHQQLFLMQLTDLLNFLNSGAGLATLLNGSGSLGASALSDVAVSTANITTNQTVSAAQASAVTLIYSVNTAFSPLITLTNLSDGTALQIRLTNASGSAVTLKLAATNSSGTAYFIFAFSQGSIVDMVATGLSVPAGNHTMLLGTPISTSIDLMAVVT